ncbi:hypothetical protein FA95DRAFT_18288 [Auriscalpium vulgare]|uniref:Uncharacterized protein n=1 Tax=Auriscalpium vulgare TaxID=40419 RepID=A0ACB8SDC2_9AGAM|nr:hypothetical protein FA95DRAFT_18288 [Auriscalpium vulgare]
MVLSVRPLPPLPPSTHGEHTRQSEPSSSRSSSISSDEPSISNQTSDVHILRSSNSLPNYSALAVKFAPLPVIEPRKRKSNVQLGIAARSRMIQQRRATAGPYTHDPPPPLWNEPPHRQEMDEEDDPFEVLGKFVVGKGKSLWRRVSQKGAAADEDHKETADATSEKAAETTKPSRRPTTENASILRHARPRSMSLDDDMEGRVWEEEVGSSVVLQVQRVSTETKITGGLKQNREPLIKVQAVRA